MAVLQVALLYLHSGVANSQLVKTVVAMPSVLQAPWAAFKHIVIIRLDSFQGALQIRGCNWLGGMPGWIERGLSPGVECSPRRKLCYRLGPVHAPLFVPIFT